jgi:hypothetical protein
VDAARGGGVTASLHCLCLAAACCERFESGGAGGRDDTWQREDGKEGGHAVLPVHTGGMTPLASGLHARLGIRPSGLFSENFLDLR